MSTKRDCARWIEIADREAIGEEVSSGDATFRAAHEDACLECGAEAGAFRALLSSADDVAGSPEVTSRTDAGVTRHVLEQWQQECVDTRVSRTGLRAPRLRHGAAWASAAIAVGVAAGVLLSLRGARPLQSEPSATRVAMAGSGMCVEAPGEAAKCQDGAETRADPVFAAGDHVPDGSTIWARHGTTCIRLEPSVVRLCLEGGTVARLTTTTGAARVVDLQRGSVLVALDPQPAGTSFSIATRGGRVTAVGTVFSVSVPDGSGAAITRVLEGKVVVKTDSGSARGVAAHEALGFGEPLPHSLSADEEADVRMRLRAALLWNGGAGATLRVRVMPENLESAARIDGAAVGAPPFSLVLAAGPHRVDVTAPGMRSATIPVDIVAGQPADQTVELVPSGAPSAPTDQVAPVEGTATAVGEPGAPSGASEPSRASSTVAPESKTSASDLVRRARELLADKHFAQAADAYDKLQATYPTSAEAHATRISLGELRLSQLHDPGGALRAFDAYLAGGGGDLTQEAKNGRIRALRALGRTVDERRAIEDFLATYPTSVQASGLRMRLTELGTSGLPQ